MEESKTQHLKMPGMSDAEDGIKVEIKEELYEVSMDDTHYEQMPEKYQPTISPTIQDVHPSLLRCRLCAVPNENMVDMFTVHKTNESIIDKIKYCLRIVVKESDNLPQQVCWSCIQELELCYQFNKFVEEAEKKLLAFGKQTSGKFDETETNLPTFSTCNTHSIATVHHNIQNTDGKSSAIARVEQSIDTSSLSSAGFSNTCIERQKVEMSAIELNSVRTSALEICQQSTCDARVSVMTCSSSQANERIPSSSQSANELRLEDVWIKQENPVAPQGSQTRRRRSRSKSANLKARVEMIQDGCRPPSEETFIAPSHLEQNAINQEKTNFSCLLCNKSFRYLSMMKMHMTTHSDKRSWECDHCKKSFKRKIHLQTHMRVCKNRTYNCNFCAALFATEVGLLRHERLHTEERPYSCDYCGKKYTSRKQRDDHHRIHTGERPFKCSLCEKTFCWSSSLKLHAAVHSNEKKFACSLCNKSYKSFNARKLHMAAVHSNEKP